MYTAKNYDRLLGLRGFSDKLLKAHFKLYEGYVVHINKMMDFLKGADKETQAYDEVKRRFAWEFNGMRLHEAYFGNMTTKFDELDPDSDLGRPDHFVIRFDGGLEEGFQGGLQHAGHRLGGFGLGPGRAKTLQRLDQ